MILKQVRVLEHIDDSPNDVLEVMVDDTIALMFAEYSDVVQYLDKDLLVEFRDDLYKGNIRRFVMTITAKTVVTTLDRKDNIRLYVTDSYNNATIAFSDIDVGDAVTDGVVYCNKQEYESSAQAVWLTLTCTDKQGRIARLRIFDYNNRNAELAGHYIMADLRRTQYGFICKYANPVDDSVPKNPEIMIAKQFILSTFNYDDEMFKFIAKTQILEVIENYLTTERGYELVIMANELNMISGLENAVPHLDLKSLKRAVVFERCYMRSEADDFSPSFHALTMITKLPLDNKKILINILDENPQYVSAERKVYRSIKQAVAAIISTRKEI